MKRDRWNERYAATDLLWSAGPNRFLAAEADDLPPGRALDLACGEGRSALWLAELGWQVTAVDFAEVGLAKGKKLAEQRGVEVDFVHADLLEWEPPARAFDLVVILYLHVTAEDLRPILARAEAAVALGGTFLMVGHDLTNLTEGAGGPPDASVLYTPDDIVRALPELEIEKAERVLRPVEGAERPAIDALVRARRAPEQPPA